MTQKTKNINREKTIVFIPGLGGHRSAFGGYAEFFPEYTLHYVDVVDWHKALEDLEKIAQKEKDMILLCNCYAVQLALRLIEKNPSAVSRIVLIEPFFAEFQWWRWPGKVLIFAILGLMKITDRFGLRRRKFKYLPDYTAISRYSIFVQPLYDMRWQSLTDYFSKIEDLLAFRLPEKVETKTFFVLSFKGFLRNPKIKKKLFSIFVNYKAVEIKQKGHNIITISQEAISREIRKWLSQNGKL